VKEHHTTFQTLKQMLRKLQNQVNVPNHKPKWVSPVRIIADARGNCYWIERGAYATREHLDNLRLAPGKVAPDADTPLTPTCTGTDRG
jgi:hypothetical protein